MFRSEQQTEFKCILDSMIKCFSILIPIIKDCGLIITQHTLFPLWRGEKCLFNTLRKKGRHLYVNVLWYLSKKRFQIYSYLVISIPIHEHVVHLLFSKYLIIYVSYLFSYNCATLPQVDGV